MDENLTKLPVEERIRIVENLWDSIAYDQKAELDLRLNSFETDGNLGRQASEAISDIRNRL